MPKLLVMVAVRMVSCMRSRVRHTPRVPFCLNPVAWPVSASRLEYRSTLTRASSVMAWVPRSCMISPAACQVVPHVSRPRSGSTTSVRPSLVRW